MILSSPAAYALAAVLGFAALGKVSDIGGFAGAIAGYRMLPQSWTSTVAGVVVGGELLSAILLVWPHTRFWGALLSLGLLAAFLVGMLGVLRRGLRVDCGCFRTTGPEEIVGPGTVVRTGLLLVLAVLAALPGEPAFRLVHLLLAVLMLVTVFLSATLVSFTARSA
ncbi:methylamine utilization protein MauE [Saccharopolyspora erythraea NRRL 2338]|uniref:Methylamine utilization protein n=2 Tax=Saccharopolyspora erythraea TaxID=1836 RepID=A4FIL0_SACEN|nr:MauE/DoxX family redox-associated membrane protein [Saccharopolyspora erythraea]EQD87892.1 methylamine utilization protein [Saccharopolyspora erythraea D]PFG97561.1 methylamine utilization protein MauE [Saccharopolyspora erythraea NRRL 2338]QRK87731.1 methylamine utilization protein [Saccharopolyspora erythraea]CAM03885.1 putative methylamine utilization protein [Saccharopolyspora erythraea NRRL 2338]